MTIYDNNKVMILIMVIIIMIVKRTRIKIEKIKTYGNILEQKKKLLCILLCSVSNSTITVLD